MSRLAPVENLLFLGIDCGTQSLRVRCFDSRGAVLAGASHKLTTRHRQPSWAEQEAEEWWQALVEGVREICRDEGIASRIAGIGVCGTSCTVVPCDPAGIPTGPAILWVDARAAAETDSLRRALCRVGWSRQLSSELLAPRLLWLARHDPHALEGRLLECVSWLVFRLSGRLSVSETIERFLWGVQPEEWPRLGRLYREIGAGGVRSIQLPREPAEARAGELLPDVAALLGIRCEGRPVAIAVGGNDAVIAALGAGLLTGPATQVEVGGSAYAFVRRTGRLPERPLPLWDEPQRDPFAREDQDLWMLQSSLESAGLFVTWLRELLHVSLEEFEQLTRRWARAFDAGQLVPTGIGVNLDLFGNKRQTGPAGSGALTGLAVATTGADLLRSVLETVAVQAHRRTEQVPSAGASASKRIVLTGGFGQNPAFARFRASFASARAQTADVYTVGGDGSGEEGGSGCRGAAMCAATAFGTYATLNAAAEAMAAPLHHVSGDAGLDRAWLRAWEAGAWNEPSVRHRQARESKAFFVE